MTIVDLVAIRTTVICQLRLGTFLTACRGTSVIYQRQNYATSNVGENLPTTLVVQVDQSARCVCVCVSVCVTGQ